MGQHHRRPRAHPADRRGGRRGASRGRPVPVEPAHGLAYKLLLSPSGAKFGKSEGGDSIWLDPDRTSPYAFYQYWLNTDDRDVGTYLRWFTEFAAEEIEALEAEQPRGPEGRAAQRALARDITARTHGAEAADQAIADSAAKLLRRRRRRSGGPALALFASAGGFTFRPGPRAGGGGRCSPTPGCSRRKARRAG